MYQKAQDNFIDPGLLSSLKRKIISEEPRGPTLSCQKYNWQDTHFVIHLEVGSKRITKNLVCRFNFFIFISYFRGYGILPMILGFGSIPTSSICRLSDK